MQKPRTAASIASFCTLLALLIGASAEGAGSAAVEFPSSIATGDELLTLHGAGTVKYLKFVDVYVGALYLPEEIASEQALEDVSKRIELVYVRRVRKWQIRMACDVALRRNLSADEQARLAPRLASLRRTYPDVDAGDRYTLTYIPGRGTEFALNDGVLATIPGSDFAAAYYRIWFGERPLSKRFKREVLAGRVEKIAESNSVDIDSERTAR